MVVVVDVATMVVVSGTELAPVDTPAATRFSEDMAGTDEATAPAGVTTGSTVDAGGAPATTVVVVCGVFGKVVVLVLVVVLVVVGGGAVTVSVNVAVEVPPRFVAVMV